MLRLLFNELYPLDFLFRGIELDASVEKKVTRTLHQVNDDVQMELAEAPEATLLDGTLERQLSGIKRGGTRIGRELPE